MAQHPVPMQGFPAAQIDTATPHPARMYNYYLGGRDNYEVDREAAEAFMAKAPDARPSALANRDFVRRAVRTVVAAGVRQIIDIGTGIPAAPNTHEVAAEVAAGVRVAYVDNDPIVATHAGARLTTTGNTSFVLGDLRDPEALLDAPGIRDLIDFGRPVALLLVAVLHFVRDEEDPAGIVRALAARLAPGSHLVLSHGTLDFHEQQEDATPVYRRATAPLTLRDRASCLRYFEGFTLLEPGLVRIPLWRPEDTPPQAPGTARAALWGGVGVKD
ncbi:SAM-dependent methyltransferase [Streptomyces sp. NPDC059740]|uniref:SAM-dependent methyltransferase n=1 Tax=Streptomyces sp. NPDC059740 TaxID=3346926 RepID=UPI0036546A7F